MSYIDTLSGGSGSFRAPRVWVQIGEAKIRAIKATVTRKATRHADTFSADLSITAAAVYGFDLPQWADWDPDQDVAILMASQAGGGDETTMITGKVDIPTIDADNHTVTITARDKSASLTQKRRAQQFKNQKSSDIVPTIAQDHGLNPVIMSTDAFAGKAYTADFATLALNRTDFEFLSQLADREGFRWYVEGDDLVFEPKEAAGGAVCQAYWYPPSADAPASGNVTALKMGKNSEAARPVSVTAKGWHHGKKKLYKATSTATGKGQSLEYTLHHNGNDQSQLEKKAKSRRDDIIRHELNVTCTMPGDLTVDPHTAWQLQGTGTIYDQTYAIDEVEFVMGWEEDFDMHITARGARPGRTDD